MNRKSMENTVIIGYSGHAFVVIDILLKYQNIIGYCDSTKKQLNPFHLTYLGKETDVSAISILEQANFFVSIGDNSIRANVLNNMNTVLNKPALNVIHNSAVCSTYAEFHPLGGILVAANAIINPISKIGRGTICNIGSSIDHECILGDCVHIAQGTVLSGNVHVGNHTFIGPNSVVKSNIQIGHNVIIQAGSIVTTNIPDNSIYPIQSNKTGAS